MILLWIKTGFERNTMEKLLPIVPWALLEANGKELRDKGVIKIRELLENNTTVSELELNRDVKRILTIIVCINMNDNRQQNSTERSYDTK